MMVRPSVGPLNCCPVATCRGKEYGEEKDEEEQVLVRTTMHPRQAIQTDREIDEQAD